MPGPRLPMRKINDVLRLSAAGMSKRKIAASLGVSATAAGECLRRARRAGLTWPLPEGLTDEALEVGLYPPPTVAAKDRRPRPDWAVIHRLAGGKGFRPAVGRKCPQFRCVDIGKLRRCRQERRWGVAGIHCGAQPVPRMFPLRNQVLLDVGVRGKDALREPALPATASSWALLA